MDAISSRSIYFSNMDDASFDADDLAFAVSVMMFRMNELVLTMHMEEFKDNIEKISEMSRQKNRFQAQMLKMTTAQKQAGLYVDEEGNLASYLDVNQDNAIDPPDLANGKTITGSLHTRTATDYAGEGTNSAAILDITIDYTISQDANGNYIFEITAVKLGDFWSSDGRLEGGTDLTAAMAGKTTFNSKDYNSLSDLMDAVLDAVFEKMQNYNDGIDAGATIERADDEPMYRQINNMMEAFSSSRDTLSAQLVSNVFDAGEAEGISNAQMDAIFPASSVADKDKSGLITVEFEVNGLMHYLDIHWSINETTGEVEYQAYIRTDLTRLDANTDGFNGDPNGLLMIASGTITQEENGGQSLDDLLELVIEDAVTKGINKLNERFEDSASKDDNNRAFFANLYGLNHENVKSGIVGQNNHDQWNSNDARMQTFLGEDASYRSGQQEGEGVTVSFRQPKLEETSVEVEFHPNDLKEVSSDVTSKMRSAARAYQPNVSDIPLDGEGTESGSARIPGFYQPNDHGALLEEVMGADIYRNGEAYTADYWDKAIIPQFEDMIMLLGNANEVVMSRIKRTIEAANAYLQLMVTDLQKQYQAVTGIFNS